jgi:glycosyltransferase involved in cell wall biosynthesis
MTDNLIINMKDSIMGAGWHEREGRKINETYRWTGPKKESTIYFKENIRDIKEIRIYVISNIIGKEIENIKIEINNKPLEIRFVTKDKEEVIIASNNNIFTKNSKFCELKIITPKTISTNEINKKIDDKRRKGIAIRKIEIIKNEFNNKPVQLCSSLGMPCGICTYTEMLSDTQNLARIKTIKDLNSEIPTHIHVQHEFGIYTKRDLKKIINYCKKNNVKFYVTMHTVMPYHAINLTIDKTLNLTKKFILQTKFNVKNIIRKTDDAIWRVLIKSRTIRKLRRIKKDILNKKNTYKNNNKNEFKKQFLDMKKNSNRAEIINIRELRDTHHFMKSQNLLIKNSDKIIVHSDEAKNELISQGAKNVITIPHPLKKFKTSKKLFSEEDGKLHVGFFGFFNKDKGILDIIDACKKIPDLKLHLYTSITSLGFDLEYFEIVKGEINKYPWIELNTKFQTLEEIVFNLSKCDLNIWYTKPIIPFSTTGSIRQYLASKRPIIARNNKMVSDLRDIITIIPPYSKKSLIEAILNHDKNTKKIEQYVETHTWEKLKAKYD